MSQTEDSSPDFSPAWETGGTMGIKTRSVSKVNCEFRLAYASGYA